MQQTINAAKADRARIHAAVCEWKDLRTRLDVQIEQRERELTALDNAIESMTRATPVHADSFGLQRS